MMDRKNFTKLIIEIVRITIEDLNDSTSNETIDFSDEMIDDSDEVRWFLDKYKPNRSISYVPAKRASSKREATPRMYDERSATTMHGIATQLASLNDTTEKPALVDDIIDVVFPWGQVGYDALRMIAQATTRTKKSFPFFEYKIQTPAPGSPTFLPFPSDPSQAVVKFLLNTRTRIGSNVTGKGEFLLALMTNGIASASKTTIGDLKIDNKFWEVKDTRNSSIRLGNTDSTKIIEKIKDTLPHIILTDLQSVVSMKLLSPDDILRLDEIVVETLSKLTGGFAAVKENGFVFYDVNDVKLKSIAKDNRASIEFK